jgi:hypothetical protein
LKHPVVSGVQIEFFKEAKYLVVMLDTKLLWNFHIKQVKDKAIKALMACRGIVRQRWGLRSAMIRWIYTMVVGPMMSYAAFVWWQKFKQTTASAELQKVQRLACLLTTRAMTSAPSIALEAINKEAAQSAFRMLDSFKPKTGDMQGHLKIYENLQRVMDQHALSDKMPIRYDFEAPLKVKIYEREEWNHEPTEQNIFTYYTDGSRKDGMIGIGTFGPSVKYNEALGASKTIF